MARTGDRAWKTAAVVSTAARLTVLRHLGARGGSQLAADVRDDLAARLGSRERVKKSVDDLKVRGWATSSGHGAAAVLSITAAGREALAAQRPAVEARP